MKHTRLEAVILLALLAFSLTACGGKSLKGKWESKTLISYDFTSKKEYSMDLDIMFTVVKIRGTYRVQKDTLYTTAEQISYDSGSTWTENPGELVPREERASKLVLTDDDNITIDGMKYTRSKEK